MSVCVQRTKLAWKNVEDITDVDVKHYVTDGDDKVCGCYSVVDVGFENVDLKKKKGFLNNHIRQLNKNRHKKHHLKLKY